MKNNKLIAQIDALIAGLIQLSLSLEGNDEHLQDADDEGFQYGE